MAPVVPSPGSPVELSSAGLEFLNNLFTKHDLDHDGNLSSQEMISLFSTCPGKREREFLTSDCKLKQDYYCDDEEY